MDIAFPFQLDARGRTSEVDAERHVRDLIELVLFTSPGERVERPEFGSGLQQLIFGPASPEMAATVQSLVQGALQRWLGGLLRVDAVEVSASDEGTLKVVVRYGLLNDPAPRQATFERGIEP